MEEKLWGTCAIQQKNWLKTYSAMEEYDIEELRKRRPLNFFAIILAIIFFFLFLYISL